MTRSASWKWWVCGLLLCATMINYMDRQTLANLSVRITTAFELNQEQYGDLEFAFGWAFAVGSLAFGFLADRVNVRWLYPIALLGWSVAGTLTGLAESYEQLLACRTLLGFFEAGHWPCALATTQRLLTREDRTMGNSVLQSGASLGAITTPLIISAMVLGSDDPGIWRQPFVVIGVVGSVWILAWLVSTRSADLVAKQTEEGGASPPLLSIVLDRRFLVLLVMVTALNTTWQIVRAWLPKFLQQGRGYSEAHALYFNSAYYIATDIGCLLAGAATLALARRGFAVHQSRVTVYTICAALAALTVAVAVMPAGWAMLGVLLLVGAGSLGLFPCYYSFTQELSTQHMGKVTGLLAAFGWFVSSPMQKLFGRVVDQTGSFDLGMAIVGLLPLIALGVMLLFWPKHKA